MKKLLWLDDFRDPSTLNWIRDYSPIENSEIHWVKNYDEFVNWIINNNLPDAICFDHDLGEEKSGYDCAKWLVDYCLTHKIELPLFNVQSSNPVGKENIEGILNSYNRFINK